jgi:hypothetical protein
VSYCSSVALFLAPVIEHTGIVLEIRGVSDKQTLLRLAGLYEGLDGWTGLSRRNREIAIVKNCEKECEDACSHGTVHQNLSGKSLDEVISLLDKTQIIFEDLTLAKFQYTGKLTNSR